MIEGGTVVDRRTRNTDVAVAQTDDDSPEHLGRSGQSLYWDWRGEDPVEIVLVLFILVLFFMLPRPSCGADTNPASVPSSPPVDEAQSAE